MNAAKPIKKTSSKPQDTKTSGKSVTLKRSVTIKAIVTDKFKEYMQFEIDTARNNSSQQLKMIDQELAKTKNPTFKQQLMSEREQIQISLQDLNARESNIKTLKNNELFVQGMIDGFVTVSLGENLYEKLGAMEIIVKDGIVHKINPIGTFSTQK